MLRSTTFQRFGPREMIPMRVFGRDMICPRTFFFNARPFAAKCRLRCLASVLALSVLSSAASFPAEPSAADVVSLENLEFFEKTVRPILAENCFECHGPEKQKSDLRLDHIEKLERGK